jgi:3-hydroxyacyl-[acyl-carrier-protein] dehydratase
MIETMAQTGGWLVLSLHRFARMPFLMQVEKAKMRAFVEPGRLLTGEATLQHDGSGYAVIQGAIRVDGKKVADAEIRYGVVPFPNETLRGVMLDTARRIGVPENLFHAE